MSVTTLEAPLVRSDTKLKIIDADTHYTEPHDLWVKRAPPAIRESTRRGNAEPCRARRSPKKADESE